MDRPPAHLRLLAVLVVVMAVASAPGCALRVASHGPGPVAAIADRSGPPPWRPAPREGDSQWRQWHQDLLAAAAGAEGAKVVFIGDSITLAWPLTGPSAWAAFRSYRPLDLGLAGDTTQNISWRMEHGELARLHPAVAVIMAGTNDLAAWDPASVARGVEAVVSVVHRRIPRARILLLGVLPIGESTSPLHDKPAAVNARLRRNLDPAWESFVDLGPLFADRHGTLRGALYHRVCLEGTVFCDRLVHPSALGYAVMTRAVLPVLARLVGEDRT